MSTATHERPTGARSAALDWAPTLLSAAAVAAVGVGTGPTGTAVGFAGATAVLAVRSRLSAPYGFAAGQVALVAALAGRQPGTVVWIAEAALLGLLLAPALRTSRGRRTALVSLVATAGLAAVAWRAQAAWGLLWASALASSATGVLMAYGLHRFEQVQLGVVERE